LLGDCLYGAATPQPPWCPRICLHACGLGIDVDDEGGRCEAEIPLPVDLRQCLALLAATDKCSQQLLCRWAELQS